MLARAATPVVIVMAETITPCAPFGATAGKATPRGVSTCKSATETSPGGDTRSGTGKPRELETQIMVGAPFNGK